MAVVHLDNNAIDAGVVTYEPQETSIVYHQGDRQAYDLVLTVENIDGDLTGCRAIVLFEYESGAVNMDNATIELPNTVRYRVAAGMLAESGEVVGRVVVYDQAETYRRTLGAWRFRIANDPGEPEIPPDDPDIPIIQSLLLDAQRLNRDTAAALDRAETVEQGAQAARTAAQAAQTAAEAAQAGAEAARDDAATHAATAGQQATASAQSATQAAGSATAAGTAKTGAETARTGAQAAQTAAESARDQAQATVANMVPKNRTVNGHALSSNVTLTAADVGAAAAERPTMYTLPLRDGYVDYKPNSSFFIKNAFGEVTLWLAVKKIDDSAFEVAYIADLPVGFRPPYFVESSITGSVSAGGEKSAGTMQVEDNGRLAIYINSNTTAKSVAGSISYLAAET